jgi:hypothetical protein
MVYPKPRVKFEPSKFDLPWDPEVIARPEPHTNSVQATFHDKPEAKTDKLIIRQDALLASLTIRLR